MSRQLRCHAEDGAFKVQELCCLLANPRPIDCEELCYRIEELSAEDLSAREPLPLYHAAAVGGHPAAVWALAAGVPISLADEAARLGRQATNLIGAAGKSAALRDGGSALALAARFGHAKVVHELLAAGANPNASTPLRLVLAADSPSLAEQRAAADIVAQLVAAGAHVTAPAVLHAPLRMLTGKTPREVQVQAGYNCLAGHLLAGRSPVATHLLLAHIYSRSLEGLLAAPADEAAGRSFAQGLCSLLEAAAAVDDVVAFCRFAAALLHCRQAAAVVDGRELVRRALHSALKAASHGMLRLALHAASAATGAAAQAAAVAAVATQAAAAGREAPAAADAAAAVQLLSAHVSGCVEELLHDAVALNLRHELQLLLVEGSLAPTLDVLHRALYKHRWAAPHGANELQTLRLLLAAGRPAVPADAPVLQGSAAEVVELPNLEGRYTCPLLALLQERMHPFRWSVLGDRLPKPLPIKPTQLDLQLLPYVEMLLEAGYRPAVYSGVWARTVFMHPREAPRRYERFDPTAEDGLLDLDGHNRWLWLAIQGEWSLAKHARFPPSFRAAVRTLLLAAHRLGSSGDWSPPCCSAEREGKRPQQPSTVAAPSAHFLGALPPSLLLHVVGLAAFPLSSWAALDVEC